MDSKLKVLFLDVDGVLNCAKTFQTSESRHGSNKLLDPYMVLLLDRIVQATGCDIVLSSSWRHFDGGKPVKDAGIKVSDITGDCCSGIRGVEINNWINKNVPYEGRDENFRYAILDDDSDMLLWQKDNFFKTSFETGLTDEIAKSVIEYLNKIS